ncbi:SDR family NAD(P)-dependent oxidoreductase [Chitiniphilus purpureus]|uniref:SDR family NAD(P)-dependent oxidoreductase n=1 Tax=Chitiniphilus purpureus TaxID=2981137 RepID=A0ABY6DRP8_9NEIS|nr:SDR family NAD(P)-dependent oxidoreductase [Chitiniphilus sp. CD1]UXY16151.1 SDR family NAD(P)-dependent oxidoreductase [Chitiniphilus sp. CD1]
MIDFVEYIVAELKSARLSRQDALDLIRQFSGRGRDGAAPPLHPLLHRNASDLARQRYAASFGGDEFFLDGHRVATGSGAPLPVLPGVAYLEMARAALVDALPGHGGTDAVQLSDVVWLKPLVVDARTEVFIELRPAGDGVADTPVEFEIRSLAGQGEELHCRGLAAFAGEAPPPLDLPALGRRMQAGELDAQAVYAVYHRMGMRFGPAHQPVARVLRGEGEALARLALPTAVAGTLEAFTLHPSLLDGALQAALGLVGDPGALPQQPSLPFALDTLRVYAGCRPQMYAWVRRVGGSGAVARLDITLCDEAGRVCAVLQGFASRTLGTAEPRAAVPQQATHGLVLATPCWRAAALPDTAAAAPVQQQVLLCGLDRLLAPLRQQLPGGQVDVVPQGPDDPAGNFTAAALHCFETVRTLSAGKGGPVLLQLVVPDTPQARLLLGLSGLLKSATLEHPALRAQLLLVDPATDPATLAGWLAAEAGTGAPLVRRGAQAREVPGWQPLAETVPPLAFREGGVYLVTGGLGGLGGLFAAEILRRTVQARVILTGRAAPSAKTRRRLAALAADADVSRLAYLPLQLTDAAAVAALVRQIEAGYGRLDGILHCAGMIADKLIARKKPAEVAQVLAPKVAGTVHLDLASRHLDLDFLALFSSGAALMGNVGQADYAAANGFLDRYAHYRNELAARGERRGLTLSIDWPLWQEGGMPMPQPVLDAMRAATGMQPLGTASGMAAFQRSLAAGQPQTVVIEGELAAIRRTLFSDGATAPAPVATAPAQAIVAAPAQLAGQTRDYLRRQFAGLFKLPYQKVDAAAPLEKYGIDSILAMDLTRQLEKTFGALSKTLFFEYQTIDELTGYFLREHAAALEGLFHTAAPAQSAGPVPPAPAPVRSRLARAPQPSPQPQPAPHAEPIAIVGLSGRYPEARDLAAFWDNLRAGRDCIVEVPASRWDWRDYYSTDRSTPGAHYSKWGGFIDGVDEFDPLFFNIPPVDAELLDPQERLFLQHAWMAVEDAGYTRAGLQAAAQHGQPGEVGVYVGVMYGEYQLFGAEASLQGRRLGVPVSYASIANRVSYLLNLHGPSMTLDSMCSSSLTAIHLACQDLRLGRTALAIAGGVNVSIHPNKYLILSAGQYISGDGHCQSFGEGGDGYIPGEGVGVVLLKRLSDAERDGNHIYGVIRASALNHGGKTNGYSVPNPKAQAGVIDAALRECGIDAGDISYIEAHGTGTRLGDPIEIAALSQVFRRHTAARQFCALGSAKSNIGHCESAAGIAGLTKVLLQLKHRQIVPSLHSARLNPHIDFASTPFTVNQTLRPWDAPVRDGRTLPRIAGISSFGAGGSNAHLIVEEYTPPQAAPAGPQEAMLIPLSARTAPQLAQKAAELAAFLADHPDLSLAAVAYTLQLGREAMDCRLALVAQTLDGLTRQLQAWARGERELDDCFHGQADAGDGVSLLSQDEDMQEAIGKWIERRKLSRLAELWVRGLALDWQRLHAGRPGLLVSLPAYPFARERYWIGRSAGSAAGRAPALHPLLHANTSDFFAQRYASVFSGTEFFFSDHRVSLAGAAPQRMLPGVACLELARAAVELALPGTAGGRQLAIRHLAWAQPVLGDGGARLRIALTPHGESVVDFEVRGADGDDGPLHCQGQVTLDEAPPPAALDLAVLRARMTRGALAPAALYQAFAALGIHYGPALRGVVGLERGQDEVLATLALPAAAPAEGYVLHPALLDSALQATLGLLADPAQPLQAPAVPFALDAAVLAAPCTPRLLAWVRYADGTGHALRRIDIDLCDEDGRVCVALRGLALRTAAQPTAPSLLLACPQWQVPAAPDLPMPACGRHQVLLCGLPWLDLARLRAALPGIDAECLAPAGTPDAAERYRLAALACFEQLRAQPGHTPGQRMLFQLVAVDDGDAALLAGLAGLIDSARLEHPALIGQLVLIGRDDDEAVLAQALRAAQAHWGDTLIQAAAGVPRVRRWQPAAVAESMPWRDDGVYLITGGLGGLGMLFAAEIVARTPDATVVLTGRAELSTERRAGLDAWCAARGLAPGRLAYHRLDLEDLGAVEALVADLMGRHGRLTGVLHSAGMLRDSLIVNKRAEDFAQVLAPKVRGTLNLDLATQHTPLDFMVLFSSLAAALGNVGQADYAAANGFMDAFAGHRNRLAATGLRQGRTLSVGWPLWQDGGMQLDDAALQALADAAGMTPLATASGMRAFGAALALDADHVLVAQGDAVRLQRALARRHAPAAAAPPSVPAAASAGAQADVAQLHAGLQRYLIETLCELLRMPAHEVDARAPLEKYGMDSVLAMKLTQALERRFGSLSKTLFFEYQTIAALARHLAEAFPGIARELAGAAAPAVPLPPAPRALPARLRLAAPTRAVDDGIAIIGLAGRYPQAPDLATFWRNLAAGRDCITEIPPARWDHAPLFDPARNQPGKSYSKWGGFLDGVDAFDPLFFNISPKEAELIDPQERLFIETAWEAIEDAGYGKAALARHRVGVYVGAMWGQYELYGATPVAGGVPSSSFASIANRVSYFFDFQGPSLALDTMCSSSLTAIHLACEALRGGAADVALAGGVNVSIHPHKYLSLSQGNFASTDGRCRSFGEGGDGYVPGEGVGAVLLKPLQRALDDGDVIHAVIKASAINHGGKTNGYTVPNPVAQAALIREALERAAIDPAGIGYIETHGTGTALGDPIEITGLARAFDGADGGWHCAIGSVKSNIGHLEAAAGIAALTKVLLQLRHGQLVPSLHAERLNPHIDFGPTPFRVQRTLADWPQPAGQPRRAAISSFGAGGANAHLIVEEYRSASPVAAAPARPELFVLSARSRAALLAYAERMAACLADTTAPLSDIAFTAQVGRTPLPLRLAVIADDAAALRGTLRQWLQQVRTGMDAALPQGVYDGGARPARPVAVDDAAVGRLLAQRDLAGLAECWVAGGEIDFAQLARETRPRRTALPTYPFERERYWLDTRPLAAPPAPGQLVYYRERWQSAMPAGTGSDPGAAGPLWCLGADEALLAEATRRTGAPVVVVHYAAGYRRLGPYTYCVDPASEDDFAALLADLGGVLPAAIVQAVPDTGALAVRLDRGVFALHALCRTLIRHQPRQPIRIVALGSSALDGQGALHRGLAGYLGSLALEHPRFAWKVLAVDAGGSAAQTARAALDELCEADWHDGEVRIAPAASAPRRELRWIERYTPAQDDLGAALKHGGVYLVTGGLGGLGYQLGLHLAHRYRARLVLSGRSGLDARLQARLDELRRHGGEPVYLQADVADAAQAEMLVREATARFGRLDGVIHAAGVHRDAYILNKTRAEMVDVLAAKVAGTLNLDRATQATDLDLFVLFSSVAGALGNPGQADYGYANRFLDAFAQARQAQVAAGARSGRTLSIGWPFWAEGGMRIAPDDLARMAQRTGMAALPSAEGLVAWETLLRAPEAHGIVLYGEPARIAAYVERDDAGAASPPAAAPPMAPASLHQAAEHYLKALLGAEIRLAVERIDAEARFDDFGVDSMMVGRINARLEQDLGELPKTLLYEYATIAELAGYLAREARPALVRHLGDAGQPAAAPQPAAPAPSAAVAVAVPTDALPPHEDIAIIGLHGHFPGAESLEQYWRNLSEGRDLVTRVPDSRWDADAFFDPDPEQARQGKIYCQWGGFLEDVDKFDAAFFGIAPDEARLIDPQERLFIQSVWAAIEDAGYTRDSLKRRYPKARSADVGVFVGVTTNSYQLLGSQTAQGSVQAPGSLPWSIANRVSYFFDFQGPSMPVDTACSSSLVAIHFACESLKQQECQVAIAGGVNLYLHPAKYQSLCRRGMLALDGKCRSFGDGDDGFIPGEGVGALVLKPLSRAIAERDHIYGVLAASVCEHSGRSNGYAAPNPNSQARLIEQALDKAGVDAESIGYVEGHGTGTQLGDSLEVVSMTQAFRKHTQKRRYCPLGAVKANVGHAESAAGIAGVAKILLQFKHRQIAPTIHSEQVNPNIDFENSPFYLQHALTPWPAQSGVPRRALINSFGAGGVNACLILQEYVAPAATGEPAAGPQLIVLSARDDARLRHSAAQLQAHLVAQPGIDLARLAYTLQAGREAMAQRLAVVVPDGAALLAALASFAAGEAVPGMLLGRVEPHRARSASRQDERAQMKTLFVQDALEALAQRWVAGVEIDWDDCHGAHHPARLPLPTYPFAKERYWVSDMPVPPAVTPAAAARLHPLVDGNVSTLHQVRFASLLAGSEYYGRDHQVNGAPLFPGAGFLEIACVVGAIAGEAPVARIEDIVWAQPLRLDASPRQIMTLLKPDGAQAQYAIVSFDDENERVLHAEGRLCYGAAGIAEPACQPEVLMQRAHTVHPGAACYRQLAGLGLHYGPAFQSIEALHVGEGFALSRLRLPALLQPGFEQYVLHPCLIDGALQTVLGMAAGADPDTAYLPFALDRVHILRPLPQACYAWVTPVGTQSMAPQLRQFDIRLLSDSGEVLVKLENFCVRAVPGTALSQPRETGQPAVMQ